MTPLHCWEDERAAIEEATGRPWWEHADVVRLSDHSGTCMLEAGHEGPHEFTPDDQIGVSFSEGPN